MMYVVWFKKDLRWHDHAPLANAAMWAETGATSGAAVLPLWVYEPAMWQQPDMAVQHLGFANECLSELSDWVQHDAQTDAQADTPTTSSHAHPGLCRMQGDMLDVLTRLRAQFGGLTLISHEETGNSWSYQRDLDVAAWCHAHGVEWREFASNGVVRRLKSLGGRNRWSAHHLQRMQSGLLTAPQGVRWATADAHASRTTSPSLTAQRPRPPARPRTDRVWRSQRFAHPTSHAAVPLGPPARCAGPDYQWARLQE